MPETTALGAAIAAGSADGIDCWKVSESKNSNSLEVFDPKLKEEGKPVYKSILNNQAVNFETPGGICCNWNGKNG